MNVQPPGDNSDSNLFYHIEYVAHQETSQQSGQFCFERWQNDISLQYVTR